MPNITLSTHVGLGGGGSTTYGTVPVPTTAQINNAQAAIDAMTSDIDLFLTADVMVHLVPGSFFADQGWSAAGDKPWGYTPVKGVSFVNNNLTLEEQRYTILHEIAHTVDSSKGVVNATKRTGIAALMVPAPDTGVAGWWSKGYKAAPNENFADTFPRAFTSGFATVLVGTRYTGGQYYQRPIPSGSYASYRSQLLGATGVVVPDEDTEVIVTSEPLVLGQVDKPGYSYFAYGSSGYPNQVAEKYIAPTDMRVVSLGAWIGGWNDTPHVRLQVWGLDGAILGQTAEFTVANKGAAANGNVDLYEVALTAPIVIPEGTDFYVGTTRNRSESVQWSTGSNSYKRYEASAAYPTGLFGEISGPTELVRRIGAYVAEYYRVSAASVYRSGAWVQADSIAVYRSGAWVDADGIEIYRTSAWVDAS